MLMLQLALEDGPCRRGPGGEEDVHFNTAEARHDNDAEIWRRVSAGSLDVTGGHGQRPQHALPRMHER